MLRILYKLVALIIYLRIINHAVKYISSRKSIYEYEYIECLIIRY